MFLTHLTKVSKEKDKNRSLVLISTDVSHPKIIELKEKNEIIDVGIAEQSAIGIAAGLSIKGFYPIIYGPASFITSRAFEQIKNNLSLQELSAIIVGFGSGLSWSAYGPTHCSIDDVNLMNLLNNVKVWTPFSNKSCEIMTDYLLNKRGLHYLSINEINYESEVEITNEDLESGYILIKNNSSKTALITSGALYAHYEEASKSHTVRENFCVLLSNQFYNSKKFFLDISSLEKIIILEDKSFSGGYSNFILSLTSKIKKLINIEIINVCKNYGINDTFFEEIESFGLDYKNVRKKTDKWRDQ